MKNARLKICIALITNKDKKRYMYIRPLLGRLINELSGDFEMEIFESWEQPDMIPHSLFTILKEKYRLWKLNRDLVSYKEMQPRNILLDLLILGRRFVLTILNREKVGKVSVLYSYITDKHIRAWARFLETDADYLICFEDDAVFKSDSALKLKLLLKSIKSHKQKPVYIDLAGGCDLGILKIEKLVSKREGNRIYFKKPISNTGCCYIISRVSADMFLYTLLRRPELRFIGVDLLINKLFILTSKVKYFTFHTYPTVFSHGSLTGSYPSLLPVFILH